VVDEIIDVEFVQAGPVIVHAHRSALVCITIESPKPPTKQELIAKVLYNAGYDPVAFAANPAGQMMIQECVAGRMNRDGLLHTAKNIAVLDPTIIRRR